MKQAANTAAMHLRKSAEPLNLTSMNAIRPTARVAIEQKKSLALSLPIG
jgi:hypothetical protein